MVSCEGPEENQAVRPRSLPGCLSLGAWAPGRPQNTQHSAHTSGTWEPRPGAAASHVFYLHLDPEPVAEADAAGAVPCGTHTPDQGEDEPGLNQLWDATQLFGGYLPEALGTVGTASGPGKNSAEQPKEAGVGGIPGPLPCGLVSLQQTRWGDSITHVSQSESLFREAGLGVQGPRVPRTESRDGKEQAPSPTCSELYLFRQKGPEEAV